MKKCAKCKRLKPIDDFYFKKKENRYGSQCPTCRANTAKAMKIKHKDKLKKSAKLYREKTKSKKRDNDLRREYGISLKYYNMMLAWQNGCCKICEELPSVIAYGKIRDLAVDHCHETGKIRGLLCTSCNVRVGVIENVVFRIKAEKYLGWRVNNG